MKYLLIPLLSLLATSKITLQSKFSKTDNSNITDNIFYNFMMFVTVALLLSPVIFKNGVSISTLVCGIIMGVLSVAFQFFYICAFTKGKMSLTVIINNFSMILPMAVSFVLFDEKLNAFKIVGTVLALISFVLNVKKDKTNKTSGEWLFYIILVFFSNGLLTVNQKLYASYTKDLQVFEFVAVTYITAAVLTFIILAVSSLKNKSNVFKKPKRTVISGCLVGIFLGAFQCLNTYAASVIEGTILYSTYNCGVSLLSVLVGRFLLKEKLSMMQYAGVITGTVAIILLCL
ncbi:MAG: EamA family transporter [Clostridia bacterium]|nr:EamA family transporter [Clostridia bacterium]